MKFIPALSADKAGAESRRSGDEEPAVPAGRQGTPWQVAQQKFELE
jgi:hypothetical protein